MPKKGGKKAKVVESPEEKALREETERMKAEEDRRRKEETMRKKLSDDMQEEARFAKLNLAKIQNQWRKLMRLAKVESLRKDLEIMSQNHEREVDMKDAIIQMLDRDCERALPTHPRFHFPSPPRGPLLKPPFPRHNRHSVAGTAHSRHMRRPLVQ